MSSNFYGDCKGICGIPVVCWPSRKEFRLQQGNSKFLQCVFYGIIFSRIAQVFPVTVKALYNNIWQISTSLY